jgi:hypothetical protein
MRVQFTAGGNLIVYDGNVSTPTANMPTMKCLLNSIISTNGAQFMCLDIKKDFYLNTPMAVKEYMRINVNDIPRCIMEQYNLASLVHNGHVLVEIGKGMYGLPQAGILAHERLVEHLAAHGYHATQHTPGLFTHEWRPITFSLVVDDFRVKYVGQEHAEHLVSTISFLYKCTQDWTGTKFLGMTIAWDYDERTVDISMPN